MGTIIKIPPPVSGGLLLSYRCSAACRHCMYACSPKWDADWISEEDIRSCLTTLQGNIRPAPRGRQSVSLNHGLHFTGGEPFLNFDRLHRAVEIAGELGIPSTFVETNCFWCRNDGETGDRLRLLKASGLRGILISVNPFYAEYVPFERTERCVRLSLDVFGDNVMVYQIEYYQLFRRLGIRDRISLEDYMDLTRDSNTAERVEMFLMGRATRQLRHCYPSYPASVFFTLPCQPPFLRDWHNHFDNYGNVVPGYCGGLSLGPWRDLDRLIHEGIDLDEVPILHFLIKNDMRGLFEFARTSGYQEPPEGYVSKCHLCLELREFLISVHDFQELRPGAFYLHLD
jgi:hypothetical protein